MRGSGIPIGDAIKRLGIFSAIAVVGGMCACIAGTVTGDAVPVVLGAIATAGGVVLAVLASLARRKTHS